MLPPLIILVVPWEGCGYIVDNPNTNANTNIEHHLQLIADYIRVHGGIGLDGLCNRQGAEYILWLQSAHSAENRSESTSRAQAAER